MEYADVYRRYAAECANEGKRAVTPEQFVDPLVRFCKGAGIRTKQDGDMTYLMNVQLLPLADRASAGS